MRKGTYWAAVKRSKNQLIWKREERKGYIYTINGFEVAIEWRDSGWVATEMSTGTRAAVGHKREEVYQQMVDMLLNEENVQQIRKMAERIRLMNLPIWKKEDDEHEESQE